MAASFLVMLSLGVRGEGLGVSARTQTLTPNPSPLTPTDRYYPETGHTLGEPFKSNWLAKGGLAVFGYPISEPYSDDSGLKVQWFERARFEYHPDLPPQFVVSLGLLGVEALDQAGVQTYELRVV